MESKYILLVEDSQDDVDIILRILKEHSFSEKAVAVIDGVEAIDFLLAKGKYLKRYPVTLPVVIMLDLKLPRMNGVELLQRIRADRRTKFIPVVMFTSSKQDRDVLDCYTAGANSYIRKPDTFEKFTEAVIQIANYWLQWNEITQPAKE